MKNLRLTPSLHVTSYNLLNNVLHGRFSAASFAKASATPGVDLARHAEALSFSLLESLTIHFGGDCLEKLMDKAVVILAENLPETLTDLFLGFQSCRKLTDMSAVALGGALHRLKKLKRLEIRLSSGPDISDEGVYALAQGLRSCAHVLEWLSLDFMGNKGKKKISEEGCSALAASLEQMQQLQKVHISMASGSKSLRNALAKLGIQPLHLEDDS